MKNQPKRSLKVGLKRTAQKSSVSPILMEMLGKLATWKPKSNEQVMEVASRLLKAAQDEYDNDHTDMGLAKKACKMLVGHTLSKFNGISYDHDYVFDAMVEDKKLILHTLHVFRRNRVAEYSVCTRSLKISVSELVPEPVGASVVNRKKWQLIPGRDLDSHDALSEISYACADTIDWIQKFLNRPTRKSKK